MAPYLLEGCPESGGARVGAMPWSPHVPMEPCSMSQRPVEIKKKKGFQGHPGPAEPESLRMEPEGLGLKSEISPELGNSATFEKVSYGEHPPMQRVEKALGSAWPPTMGLKHPWVMNG